MQARVSYSGTAEVVRDVTLCHQASAVTDTSLHPTRLYLHRTNNDKNIRVRISHVLFLYYGIYNLRNYMLFMNLSK